MNGKRYTKRVIGLLVFLTLISLGMLAPYTLQGLIMTPLIRLQQAAAVTPITGEYNGGVALTSIYSGVYSDTVAVPSQMDLGDIELALTLTRTGDAVRGHIVLERTTVFTKEHTITVTTTQSSVSQSLAVGPLVQGRFINNTLYLESEPFTWEITPARTLQDGRVLPAQRVTRQFRLVTTTVLDEGATLVGEYRETLWGFTPQPATVVGEFSLQRPVWP